MKDKQPRSTSHKGQGLDKLHPASEMGKRAKGGDKVSNPGTPKREPASGAVTTPGKKAPRP